MDGSEFLAVHPDPVVEYAKSDEGVGVRRVNPAFEAVFGTDGSSVSLPSTLATDEAVADVAAAIESGESLDVDVPCETSAGTRTFRLRNVPNGDDDGFLLYTDVTERTDREGALERRNEQLEAFASVVSHDLRNPIDVARTYLDSARQTGEDEHFDRVDDALDRMRTLIEDVLQLAREGQVVDDTERVALAEVAEDAWAGVDTDAASLELPESEPTLQADPARLQQLLANLYRNAVEHGGDDVTVTVGTTDDDDCFYVADDGTGVPPDERSAVFEPGVSSSTEGTGLGLTIVDRIAEAHDWSATLTESEAGGARFEIEGVDSLQPF